jgi:hypothetical protein
MLYKNKRYITPYASPLGSVDERRYLFMCAPLPFTPSPLDRCKTDNAEYCFTASEVISLSDKPLYVWGVLEKINEEAGGL